MATVESARGVRDAENVDSLPVIWRTIIEIPLGDSTRCTRQPFADSLDRLSARAERLARAKELLLAVERITQTSDWGVTITPKKVFAERFGEEFTQLSDELQHAGFTYDDYAIRVEYARKWGML